MSDTNRSPQFKEEPSAPAETQNALLVRAITCTQDSVAVHLAALVCIAAETFNRICQIGELDFVAWRGQIDQRLTALGLAASEEELEWLEEHLPYEPNLKGRIGAARRNLNNRLHREPALPAGATISLFMNGSIEKNVVTLRADDISTPTATITLQAPLHFVCHRGAIFQFDECQVVAQMPVSAIPGGIGTPAQEIERFVLESESDFSRAGDMVALRYPSLNKVFPGIFNRLHLSEGKQNTNRSIYYHAAWKTRDGSGKTEYHSLWSIREGVRQRTWRCPELTAL